MPRRLAVIVLGMHRSGTSAVAGTAVRLGLAAPRMSLPASADNPGGFHESALVVMLNQWLLRQAGSEWYDCFNFNISRLPAETRAEAPNHCLAILREEFADAPAFLVKDPRLCLTLPVWLPALRAAGADVAVLLVIRHPEEAVRSLCQRDRLPEATVASLWLHYTLEAERASRGLPRAMVAYEDLLHDWRGCMAHAARIAGIAWPGGFDAKRPDIDAFLDLSSRHHFASGDRAAVGPPPLHGLIDITWAALRQLHDDPATPFACEWLDQVRRTFAARVVDMAANLSVRFEPPRPAQAGAGER